MKNTIKSIQLTIIISLIVFSCSSNDDNTDDADQRKTYINYSVAGNQINGTFNFDGLNPNVTIIANVYPESDSANLKKALIVYLNSGELGVPMSVPARKG